MMWSWGIGRFLANNTLLGGHVMVEDGAFLGGATLVHQNVRIGRLAITRGGDAGGEGCATLFHGDGCEYGERDQPDRAAAGGAVA